MTHTDERYQDWVDEQREIAYLAGYEDYPYYVETELAKAPVTCFTITLQEFKEIIANEYD